MTDLAHVLLGAVLVAIGVLAGGFADRLRGIRFTRATPPHDRSGCSVRPSPAAIDAGESRQLEPTRSSPQAPSRGRRLLADGARPPESDDADDVINALVAAGYKKLVATEAARGCREAERVTVEQWTRAALRRCAKGAVS